jgi:quinol monooxygenase YgiN
MLKMSLLLAALLAGGVDKSAEAQQSGAPGPKDASVYAVTYIEVAPAARDRAAGLLRQLADAARGDEGNTRFDILQRVLSSNHFAIVSIWKEQSAYERHAATAHSKEFREKIKPHLISAIDDRLHSGLAVSASSSTDKLTPEAVYVVTHVDVPPPRKDECVQLLDALVADSRKEAGAQRFEVFQQSSRPNHFSVVEVWRSQAAYDAHITSAHTRHFREQLTPMSGALYDERLYRLI